MAIQEAATAGIFAPQPPTGVDISPVFSFGDGAADGDSIRFCKLAKGTRVVDLSVLLSAGTTDLAFTAGFEPVDGSTADPDAYIAGGAGTAAGRVRANTGTPPDELAADSWLTLTFSGAALPDTTDVTVIPTTTHAGYP